MDNLIVMTGGPGSGKTSLLEKLIGSGFICAGEAGRKIIRSQLEINGNALPWKDKVAFRDEMLKKDVESYKRYQHSNRFVFFDRGIVDTYGYSKLENLLISDELIKCCRNFRYNSEVFIFPPWKDIFTNDAERKQDFDEATATYNEMVSAYKYFGYSLVELPLVSVEERLEFILGILKPN